MTEQDLIIQDLRAEIAQLKINAQLKTNTPVIRCRCCKFYNAIEAASCAHARGMVEPNEDDFCSCAEVRVIYVG